MIESATFWKDGPEIETGELRTEDIAHRGVLLPGRVARGEGRHLHPDAADAAVAPQGRRAAGGLPQRTALLLPPRPQAARAADGFDGRARPAAARPDLGLPGGRARRAVRRGRTAGDQRLPPDRRAGRSAAVVLSPRWPTTVRRAAAAGSTPASMPTASTRPRAASPAASSRGLRPDWGWAWPANRRILYNRASADPNGRPWSERKALRLVGRRAERRWTGHDVPDFVADRPPAYRPEPGTGGPAGLAGDDPFIMQARRQGLAVRAHRVCSTGRCRRTTSRGVAGPQPVLPAAGQPDSAGLPAHGQLPEPVTARARRAEVFPFVFTTYRLTEHHTAGGMSRWLPYLSELQPEFFCEVSPELGADARVSSTSAGRRSSLRGPRSRRGCWSPTGSCRCRSADRTVHQVGLPYHWGVGGSALVVAATRPTICSASRWIRTCTSRSRRWPPATSVAGRRPTGPALLGFVEEYQQPGRDHGRDR